MLRDQRILLVTTLQSRQSATMLQVRAPFFFECGFSQQDCIVNITSVRLVVYYNVLFSSSFGNFDNVNTGNIDNVDLLRKP